MKKIRVLLSALALPLLSLAQSRFDVVIDEVMADPSPVVGLPNSEWLELRNRSHQPVNLQSWRIADATGQSGPLPSFVLQPDSFVVVCSSGSVAALSAFGSVISVTSFPSLDNDGDLLSLKAPNGRIIHAIQYTTEWYKNDLKRNGGWSLEMIDAANPCTGIGNWTASINPAGGTPGKKNSRDAMNPDASPPILLRSYSPDSLTIVLVFNEPLDSASAAVPANYSLTPSIGITGAQPLPPLFDRVQLQLGSAMIPKTVYTLRAKNFHDCSGNDEAREVSVNCGVRSPAVAGDCVINEILFNPRPNGYDYVELFNRSDKIVDLSQVFLANRTSSGSVGSIIAISPDPFLLFPGEYIAATENFSAITRDYLIRQPDRLLTVSSMPSYPDDNGDVILLNSQGNTIDELNYDHHWHFPLIRDEEGVTLERIDPDDSTQKAGNWHSAASTAGFGTPGYRNSQWKTRDSATSKFSASPPAFSPDNDGRNDVVQLTYTTTTRDQVGTLSIFDIGGRKIRRIAQNALLGFSGTWNWDGLDDNGAQLPIGNYVALLEVFDLNGKVHQFKTWIALLLPFR